MVRQSQVETASEKLSGLRRPRKSKGYYIGLEMRFGGAHNANPKKKKRACNTGAEYSYQIQALQLEDLRRACEKYSLENKEWCLRQNLINHVNTMKSVNCASI